MVIQNETLINILTQDEDILKTTSLEIKKEEECWKEIQGYVPKGFTNELPFIEMAREKLYKMIQDLEIPRTLENKSRVESSLDYYFFMEASGGNAYLSHLDIKILKHEFQKYSEFPVEIEVPIQNIVDVKVDEVRKFRI